VIDQKPEFIPGNVVLKMCRVKDNPLLKAVNLTEVVDCQEHVTADVAVIVPSTTTRML